MTLRAAGGHAAASTTTAAQLPGTYPVAFPPAAPSAPAPGRWSFTASAVDDDRPGVRR